MDIPWDDVRLFLAIAEGGSLSAAARKLRLGQPTLSRRLAALEYQLGATLFRRGVEGTTLTAAGERLLEPARRMAEWSGEVARAAERTREAPTGLVRVTASPYQAWDFLAPFAAWLAGRHPGLRLEVLSTMHYLDLSRGEADLALRLRPPTQPELVKVHTLEYAHGVFAARSLAARLPRHPRMDELPWVAWAPPYDRMTPNPELEELIPGFVPAFTSDNYLVLHAAAEAGLGAMVMGKVRHRFTRPSTMVPVRIDLGPYGRGAVHLVCARTALAIPRVRLVADLLVRELARARVS